MIELSKHIEYLLGKYDCVVVPGLGAFLAEYTPAGIQGASGVLFPPTRKISFNSKIRIDDDRLITGMMRRHGYSRSTAGEVLDDSVSAIKSALSAIGKLRFGNLGEFIQVDSTINFKPADEVPLSINPFGALPSLQLTKVIDHARREAQISASGIFSDKALRQSEGQEESPISPIFLPAKQSKKYWLRIAAILVIIATFGVAFIKGDSQTSGSEPILASIGGYGNSQERKPIATELYIAYPDSRDATASIIPSVPAKRAEGEESIESVALPVRNQASAENHLAVSAKESISKKETGRQAKEKVASTPQLREGGKYALIVASLPTMAEAKQFMAEHPSASMSVIETDGRYRVAIATSDSKESLSAMQSKISAKYKGAWIFKSK